MRFVFLGTGTSAGVPNIGCDCAVCTSSDPRDTRLRAAAAVQFTDQNGSPRTVLLDAGPDLRQQALRHRLDRCDAIFFTHNHVDHIFGLDEVRRFNALQQSPIPIYADAHTMESLRRVYKHVFDRDQNVNDSFVAHIIPHTLTEAQVEAAAPTRLHGVRFTPLRVLHGKLPILGYRIERDGPEPEGSPFPLAYLTDVSAIPTATWARLTGLRTLVIDALRHRRHPTHFTIAEALHAADRIGAHRTWFIHMSHDVGHEETEADLPPDVRLAYDGLVLGA